MSDDAETRGLLHHAAQAYWEPCENCGTRVCAARQVGVRNAPVSLWEGTGTINGKPSLGEHTPGRCAAIRSGAPVRPFVGEVS